MGSSWFIGCKAIAALVALPPQDAWESTLIPLNANLFISEKSTNHYLGVLAWEGISLGPSKGN